MTHIIIKRPGKNLRSFFDSFHILSHGEYNRPRTEITVPHAKGENERVANMTASETQNRRCGCGSGETNTGGVLRPCKCYLAIATVPMQNADWNKVYGLGDALARGTLFPELDLPFVGSGR